MGEYARRISDGERIKIGTCESMYYLRLEDKEKVEPEHGSGFGIYYRLPFPDEDDILPGNYDKYNRSFPLFNDEGERFTDGSVADDNIGIMQVHHECGLLINVPCYHGVKLPEVVAPMKVFWGGKGSFLELAHLKEDDNGKVWPIVKCKYCDHMWRYTWDDIKPYLHGEMLYRLSKYFHDEKI